MFTKATAHLRPFIRLPTSHSTASPDHFTANPSLLHHLPQHGAGNAIVAQGQHSAQAGNSAGHAGRAGYGGGAGAGGGYTGHARAFLSLPQTQGASVDPSLTNHSDERQDQAPLNASLLLKRRPSQSPRVVTLNDSVRVRREIEARKGGREVSVVDIEPHQPARRRESIADYAFNLPQSLSRPDTPSLRSTSHTPLDLLHLGLPHSRSLGLRALSSKSAQIALEVEDVEAVTDMKIISRHVEKATRTLAKSNKIYMDLAGQSHATGQRLGGVRRNSTAAVERPSLDQPPIDFASPLAVEQQTDHNRKIALIKAFKEARENQNIQLISKLITHYRSSRTVPPFSPDALPGVPELAKHYPLPSNFSLSVYNAALHALSVTRTPGQTIAPILEIYNELLEKDLVPDSVTYGFVIRALALREAEIAESKAAWEKQKLWSEWRSRLLGDDSWNRDLAKERDATIQTYLAEGNLASALKLFRAAALTGQARKFNVIVYGVLLDVMAKVEDIDLVTMTQIFEHAKSHQGKGLITLYKHMFTAHAKIGNVEEFNNIWLEFNALAEKVQLSEWGLAINEQNTIPKLRIEGLHRDTWEIALISLIKLGELGKAFEVFGEMLAATESPLSESKVPAVTIRTCGEFVVALAEAGELDLALEWYDKLKGSTLFIEQAPHRFHLESTSAVVDKFILSGRYTDAARLVKDWKEYKMEFLSRSSKITVQNRIWRLYCAFVYNARSSPENAAEYLRNAQEIIEVMPSQIDLRPVSVHLSLLAQSGSHTQMPAVLAPYRALNLNAHTLKMLQQISEDTSKYEIPVKYRIKMIEAWARHGVVMTTVVAEKLVAAYLSERASNTVDLVGLDKNDFFTIVGALAVLPRQKIESGEFDKAFELIVADIAQVDVGEDSQIRKAKIHQAVQILIQNLVHRFSSQKACEMLTPIFGTETDTLVGSATPETSFGANVSSDASSPMTSTTSQLSSPMLIFSQLLTSSIDRFTQRNPPISVLEAYVLLRSGLSQSQVPRLETILNLMDHLARHGDEPKVRELYELSQVVLSSLVRPELQAQSWLAAENAILIACCHLGYLEEAGLHRSAIIQAGFSPSADAYATMIASSKDTTDDALIAREMFEEALGMGVKPHLFLYNTVISKLSKARKAEAALELFKKMKQEGIRPSSVTYGALINACCRVGDALSAETLFEEMTSQPNFRPRIPPYNTMMQFYLQTQPNRDRFFHYYSELQRAHVHPSAHTYKLLLDAYATLAPSDLSAMEFVFSQLVSDKTVKVQGTHWASLISAYGLHGNDLTKAKEIFEKVPEKGGAHDPVVWEAWLNVLSQKGSIEQLEQERQRMIDSGVQPTAYVFNVLINGYSRAGNITQARQVFESMGDSISGVAAPNNHPVLLTSSGHAKPATHTPETGVVYREPSTYETMIRAEVACGDRTRAEEVLKRMEERGYPVAVFLRSKAALEGEVLKFH
ncbi:hypothetical protein L204_102394 [Cryptococcus depauperatus]|nr:hypothetical protein L204_05903 [Cryptococcus depauperatus CBS 7855]